MQLIDGMLDTDVRSIIDVGSIKLCRQRQRVKQKLSTAPSLNTEAVIVVVNTRCVRSGGEVSEMLENQSVRKSNPQVTIQLSDFNA